MDDKNNLSEYKFDESEGLPAASEAEPTPIPSDEPVEPVGSTSALGMLKQIFSKFNLGRLDWKRLIRPMIIVLAIIFLYIGFTFFTSKKEDLSEQEKMSAQERAALVEMQPIEPKVEPMIVAPPVVVQDRETKEKIDQIVQYINESQEYMSGLSGQVSNVMQEISDINRSIEQLTMAMQKIFLDVENLKSPPKKVVKKPAKVPVAYHVRAIVPGRVWLRSVDGKNVTLRVGDKLKGYGEVRIISPRQGMVVMSNGAIIQYGINDF